MMKGVVTKGFSKLMMTRFEREQEMEKCGNCCYFRPTEKRLTKVRVWVYQYSMLKAWHGVCNHEFYLRDNPNEIEVNEHTPACALMGYKR